MKIPRRFTVAGCDPFASVRWVRRSSRITNPDGSVVFQMEDAEVPESWSQLATDIVVSKYFRKAGVPQMEDSCALPGQSPVKRDAQGRVITGPERSVRQVVHRLAGCWRHWGQTYGYFDSDEDAQAFYDELVSMMLHQMGAPNSPQWFNTGLAWAYGITGPAQGHWIADPATGEPRPAPDAYTHPQPHACFIQSVRDDLVNEGGIMDLWVREARLFKYGSGTGTNFSPLRAEGEPLSGGGRSSGLMSWLRIGDRAASAIRSGGTTRRAAKMVCLDMDHPDIRQFIQWKAREEIKVRAMVEGMRLLMDKDPAVGEAARRMGLTLDYDFNGEAYQTVSGQNSNNSVRIPDAFFEALDRDGEWKTYWRTSGQVARVFRARELWDDIADAAWRCADPGVQFDTTINAWHTCPGAGRINASNPCSEYMFLDDTACNLASLNVLRFFDPLTRTFDVGAFEHAVDLWTIVLEISVLMASFPSREIARRSWMYRTLGLGYANLGALLMQAGIPYDSEPGRAVCAMITAILTGRAYRQSALLAAELGPFPGFAPERQAMLRVIRNHRRAAMGVPRDADEWEQLRIRPVPIDHALVRRGGVPLGNAGELLDRAVANWNEALSLGERYGYRNAQTTVIAPTGTIGLLMDCDTTGVEPDFALVKFKKLAGGGYFKIANESVAPALRTLGYADTQIRDILTYLLGTLDLDVPMPAGAGSSATEGLSFRRWLMRRGFSEEDVERIRSSLPTVFDLRFAFGPWALGEATLRRVGIDPAVARSTPGFSVLRHLGLTERQIEALNTVICGTQTVEGAPHLRPEHLSVFDCANRCGKRGTRFISPQGHIRMMAAAQPFISGAISKTINLPRDATVEDIKACYRLSWELGLKANALYRDGCKMSQPLSTSAAHGVESQAEAEEDALGEPIARRGAGASSAVRADAATERQEAAAGGRADAGPRPMRRRLPDTRRSITHKFNVAGHEGYLTVGLYDDGKPGELFITMAKEGSTIGGLMDSLGTATSVALQYGVPIESLVNKFTHQRFEPAGPTANSDIPFAKSLVDYIFRWLGMQFIPGYREANAPRRPSRAEESPSASAFVLSADPSYPDAARGAARVPINGEHDARFGSDRSAHPGSAGAMHERGAGGAAAPPPSHLSPQHQATTIVEAAVLTLVLDTLGDAPACDVCGTITVRSGTCYKCLNCGNSMGCS